MKKRICLCLCIVFLLSSAIGCAPLIIGAAVGGVTMYAVSKDTIEGVSDKPYGALWNAALSVSKIRGTIKQENLSQGIIYFETESNRVWIRLIRLTRATTRVRISARRYHLPNIDLAQEVFTKIMEEVR